MMRGKRKRKSSKPSYHGPKVGRDKPGVEPKPGTSLAKPLKVCNVRRTRQVGIVAASLQDLRAKIRTRFRAAGNEFEIVLEEDCTRVEDNDYFQTLSDNTVLMAVSKGEQWTEAATSLQGEDEEGLVEVDGAGPTSPTNRLDRVAKSIAKNPAVMAFLPKVELEIVVDSDINRLQVLLCQSKEDAQFIQDACERRLTEMIQSEEARNLLKLYHRARNVDVVSGSPPSKAEAKSSAISVKAQTESQDWSLKTLGQSHCDILGKIPGQSQLYGVKSGIVQ